MALIHEQLIKVMQSVQGIAKRERNEQQRFLFRGIDSVLNAVGPALREHEIFITPVVMDLKYDTIEVGQQRRPMAHVVVQMEYQFNAADGSRVGSQVVGESMDSGDKAVSKAMSVALRIALLQTLALPTDEKDPDHDIYERSTTQPTATRASSTTPPHAPPPPPTAHPAPGATHPVPTSPTNPPQATPTSPAAASPPHPDPTSLPVTTLPSPTTLPAAPTSPAIPTNQASPDQPDATAEHVRQAILDWGQRNNVSPVTIAQKFRDEMDGDIREASFQALNSFYAQLVLNAEVIGHE
jgi:hypothetical protein